MLKLHSFLQTAFPAVRSLAAKEAKQMRRLSSLAASGAMVAAVTAILLFLPGSGKTAMAVPTGVGMEAEGGKGQREGIRLATEANVQIGSDERDEGEGLALLERAWEESRAQEERLAEAAREAQEQQRIEEAKRIEEAQTAAREREAARKAAEEKAAQEKATKEQRNRLITCTDEDYQVLLRIVEAEAGICDEKGKILVSNVIINRVRSDEFPGSVKAVVYEPSQFQPVSNGLINSVKVTDETVACVDRALAGEDYSQGALFFMNRRGSGSAAGWFDRHLEYLFAHDGHEFFR